MASIGTLYACSIFVAPIEAEFRQSHSATSLIFSVATVAFTIGMLARPLAMRRRPPQAIALLSCLMAAAGLALSGTAGSIWLILLGFGVLFGLANGFGYSISLQVVQHTVPRRRGLFTGTAVSSYMLGSVVGSPLLSAALALWSYRVVMLILAAYLVAAGMRAFLLLQRWRIGACIIPTTTETARMPAPFSAMVVLWDLVLSSLVGVTTLAHAAPLAASLQGGDRHLALTVALVALGNGAGRLAGGWLSDRLHPRTFLSGAPALSGVAPAAVVAIPRIDVMLTALCVIGVVYGCIAGCLPAIVAKT